MRPRGEIREALCQAADRLVEQRGRFIGRDAAAVAQVGWEAARRTLQNMVQASELVVVDTARVAGVCRPVNVYAKPGERGNPAAELLQAVRCWADFR